MYAAIHIADSTDVPHEAALHKCATEFSPYMEVVDERTLILSVSGMSLLFPGGAGEIAAVLNQRLQQQGVAANIAVGDNLSLVVLAACFRKGITNLHTPAELQLVSRLALTELPLPAELQQTLALWGLTSLGQLAQLPLDEVRARLGEPGAELHRLVTGKGLRILNPIPEKREFWRAIVFEDEVKSLEPCQFLSSNWLAELTAELNSYGYAARELLISCPLSNQTSFTRTLRLPVPTTNQKLLFKLLQVEFEKWHPEAPLLGYRLDIIPDRPRRIQLGLFTPASPEPELLELTIARIRRLVGTENVGVPVLLDSLHPQPFMLDAQLRPAASARASDPDAAAPLVQHRLRTSFRYCTPPLKIEIKYDACQQMKTITVAQQQMRVMCTTGPWVTSGHWWDQATLWSREEWDVACQDGPIMRIYLDLLSGSWFLDGYYD